jgi:membrane protein
MGVKRVKALPERISEHNLTLVSAGVTFYAFLAFIPALIIVVAVYGRVSEPRDIKGQVHDFAGALPHAVERFVTSQITAVSKAGGAGISITVLVALLIALWSASGAMAALVTGISVALDQDEAEGFVKKRLEAMALMIGAVALLCTIVFFVAALPTLVTDAGLGSGGRLTVNVLRWPVLLCLMTASLGVIYPPRRRSASHDMVRRDHTGRDRRRTLVGARLRRFRGVHGELR